MKSYDLIVVGAGIVGLGAALAAHRQGLKVAVVERSARAVGASIRNFGFVTVTGQRAGAHWERARRARDIWAEVAPQAGIPVLHAGLVMPAYREEAEAVMDAFLRTEMGAECRRITPEAAQEIVPSLRIEGMRAALYSPHELRVESMTAVGQLAAWLGREGVEFHWSTTVLGISGTTVETSRGTMRADGVIVCPGDDFATLYPERFAPQGLRVCTLQMLRVVPGTATTFNAAVMSDLSYGRYEGFTGLPEARALEARLNAEYAQARAAGIHVIAVQSADGSLVVGDSHVYDTAACPFAEDRVDALILDCFDELFDMPGRQVSNRWTGTYASGAGVIFLDRPAPNVRLICVTGGTGASTAFALGEQVLADLHSPAAEGTFA
ncbi:TIGR03364 family FAD-dependent oxidoreductase [Paenirhodobacter sp.]|uniref:TIGR03364 family FAD-dependent oxidoreductase n=1 Tax=Paenirhodobacter sp. TaxID=1965326 RepID=UPI003B3CFCBB